MRVISSLLFIFTILSQFAYSTSGVAKVGHTDFLEGGIKNNGGNTCEIVLGRIKHNLSIWIESDGPQQLSYRSGMSPKLFRQKVKNAIDPEKITIICNKEEISQGGKDKECRNFTTKSGVSHIVCNKGDINNLINDGRFGSLVEIFFHEILGVAGLEENLGNSTDGNSDYFYTLQIAGSSRWSSDRIIVPQFVSLDDSDDFTLLKTHLGPISYPEIIERLNQSIDSLQTEELSIVSSGPHHKLILTPKFPGKRELKSYQFLLSPHPTIDNQVIVQFLHMDTILNDSNFDMFDFDNLQKLSMIINARIDQIKMTLGDFGMTLDVYLVQRNNNGKKKLFHLNVAFDQQNNNSLWRIQSRTTSGEENDDGIVVTMVREIVKS